MNQKHQQNIFMSILKVNVMVKNVIQIKSEISISIDMSIKKNKAAEKL